MNMHHPFFAACFWIFAVYFSALTLYYLFLAVFAFFEAARRQRQHERETYEEMSLSYFTLPVSVIIPAYNEEKRIADAVLSVLNLDYPLYELIVVDDQSDDQTLQVLKDLLELKPIANPYKDLFRSGKILGFFRSQKHPHVRVMSKTRGQKKAGALNAAMNIARYKYICSIDSDTVLEPDALMKVMAQVQKDPEVVVGAGSTFGLSNGFEMRGGRIMKKRFINRPLISYQILEYIRSFIGSRIAWSRWNAMPIVAGGFQVWRRDMVQNAGGYDPFFSSEDLEFTFRVHDYMIRKRKEADYRILMLPYQVGWTAGPDTVASLIKQRNRWHRVTLEAVWRFRKMFFNPLYRALGTLTMPYFVFYESMGPFVEASSVLITLAGFASGIVPARLFLGVFVLMLLCNVLSSVAALLIHQRNLKMFRTRELAYLIFLSFCEMFWYRWIIIFARFWGAVDFLRGERKMDRIHEG